MIKKFSGKLGGDVTNRKSMVTPRTAEDCNKRRCRRTHDFYNNKETEEVSGPTTIYPSNGKDMTFRSQYT